MAAPSAGRPVTVTVGSVWKLQLNPSPPTPISLTVGAVITWTCLTVARVTFGVVYFRDCPQQPNIPNYLLGLALIPLLMIPFVTLPCESYAAQPREPPRGFRACVQGVIGLFIFVWSLLGDVWVFSVYQPNYDPSAADGLYCNKTLYTFAFWNAVFETFGFGVLLAKFCKGMLCYVHLSPVDRDFYRNV
ncbi:transmembrane protein 272-like isoform X2 [Poeciliopsis prolifica]|uniref:transmembrane protein 272-like isoform X2 n=1 Tax=Poeciliopsis prolifica TaxID=188132 RepID=UPI002414274F|nr:transmembrane protein 272-like isoform X2 [Poeciliopsis prolifica]